MSRRLGDRAGSLGLHGFLVFYALLTLTPFVWAVLTSFKSVREIALAESILPVALNLNAYRQILGSEFSTWFYNSMSVAIIVTCAGTMMMSSRAWKIDLRPTKRKRASA